MLLCYSSNGIFQIRKLVYYAFTKNTFNPLHGIAKDRFPTKLPKALTGKQQILWHNLMLGA